MEIAVRALSPGVNAPFTAMTCVEQLGAGLSKLVERSIPAGYHYDNKGHIRLLTDELTFTDIINSAFDMIRQNAYASVAVSIQLFKALQRISDHTLTKTQKV